ncbi:MAG: hypothetical protein M5U28_36765 [Sandaracinaceae bacterium]|nr:hypothetical protein [Sandaracinaceae bacterium]
MEIIAGLGEDPERVAKRLLARTTRPMVTDVTIEGSAVRGVAPARVPDLYAGSPSLVSLALAPDGGTLVVRGKTAEGDFEERLEVPATALGEGLPSVATLFGRERVEDLETEGAASGDGAVDREIEAVGLRFRIATRMTSWVAVSDDVTVDPDAEKRAERQPHEVPHGVSIEGLGLRAPQAMSMTLAGGGPDYAVKTMAGVLKVPFPGAPPAAAPMGAAPPARRRATAAPAPRSMQAPPPSPSFAAAPPPPRMESPPSFQSAASEEVSDLRVEGAATPAPKDRPEALERRGPEPRAPEERAPELAAPAEQPAPAKGPRRWLWIVLAIVIAVAIAIGAWLALSSVAAPEPTLPSRRSRARVSDLEQIQLAMIAAGDADVFATWMAGAEPALRAGLRRFAAHVDTEAVLQETLLRVWQVAPRFVPDGRPDGLLRLGHRIARNLAVSEIRKHGGRAPEAPSKRWRLARPIPCCAR